MHPSARKGTNENMNALVVYTSQTGFTEQYATWLAQKIDGQTMTLKAAKKKDTDFFDAFDTIVYGGWLRAGKMIGADWFIDQIEEWKDKNLALLMVGASPKESTDIQITLHNSLTDEQKKYAQAFYCQGGLNYEKMSLRYKVMARLIRRFIKKRIDPKIAKLIAKSSDRSRETYLVPLVRHLERLSK